jgi:hypothetical protein
VLSKLLATHTKPAPTAIPAGPFPAATVCRTVFVLGSIRDTESRLAMVTHSDPSP